MHPAIEQKKFNQLTQEELLLVLRSLLKVTRNDTLSKLPELPLSKRVEALLEAIYPSTWEEACKKHFDLKLKKEQNPKVVYLDLYKAKRLGS